MPEYPALNFYQAVQRLWFAHLVNTLEDDINSYRCELINSLADPMLYSSTWWDETLRRAQAELEKHQELAVRVSGFSQRFCLLRKELQDHIIARTKHAF